MFLSGKFFFMFKIEGRTTCGESSIKFSNVSYKKKKMYAFLIEK